MKREVLSQLTNLLMGLANKWESGFGQLDSSPTFQLCVFRHEELGAIRRPYPRAAIDSHCMRVIFSHSMRFPKGENRKALLIGRRQGIKHILFSGILLYHVA